MDSVFITGSISAHKEQDNMAFDLPGAFVTTNTDKHIIMTIWGHLYKIMTRRDPKMYGKYITKDKNGKPVLYVQLYKSLYGLLRLALLFYKKFKGELEEYGFGMNRYNPCVFIRIINNGNQHTAIFHVDNGLASHMNPI